jgi:hypothetical protein
MGVAEMGVAEVVVAEMVVTGPLGVAVGISGVPDRVTICGSKVQVGALVRVGIGLIVAVEVQVGSRRIITRVLVGVSVL